MVMEREVRLGRWVYQFRRTDGVRRVYRESGHE